MTGYRLTFSTMHLTSPGMVDTAVAADGVLGGVHGFIAEEGEVLSHRSLLSALSAQHIIRFEAADDAAAYRAAEEALRWAHRQHPVDGERLERRGRSYAAI